MDKKRLKLEELLDALMPGVTLVTVNQRLARHLRRAYDTRQQARGLLAWESPDILPWAAWLQRCWQDDTGLLLDPSAPAVLNTHQEQLLWERAVAAAMHDHPLLHVPATAESARQAWDLLHAWELVLPNGDAYVAEDGKAFGNWARDYERWCREGGWLDQARLSSALSDRWTAAADNHAARLLVMGFDELTPAQSTLLRRLNAAGCPVTAVGLVGLAGAATARVSLPDPEQELRAAARWVLRLLEDGAQERIGVVVPDLATVRVQLETVFDEVLTPSSMLPAQAAPRPYNLSLAPPLLEWPLVHAAFTVLELGRGALPIEQVGTLLRSPFTAGAEKEIPQRALLDLRLRGFREPRVSLATLERQARSAGGREAVTGTCPILAACLGGLLKEAPSWQGRRSASAWAEIFSRILALLGWPGDRTLDSTEYQTVHAWHGLLVDLSSLDAVSGLLSYGESLSRLRRLASTTPFQPAGSEVPVQVLGILEAAGAHFDHLWVMGLHDEAWPTAPRPNPFLPLALQRQHGLPHASADRELAFAQALTRRLAGSAREVVFSYPARRDDRVLRPSPLIAAVREQLPEHLGLSPAADYARGMLAAGGLEELPADPAPSLKPADEPAGGTAVLRDQAACPFRAFAIHRLGARGPEPVRVGLDAVDRGSLVHAALQRVWEVLESYAALCRRTPEQLGDLVRAAVRRAVSEAANKRPLTFTERFTELEEWRLSRLISGWLEQERGRRPFVVVGRELSRRVEVGGVSLETRPDRVDRLLGGGLVILDYKTGRTSRSMWYGDRPEEPQLPVYATTTPEPVDAVLFARLRPGDMGFEGVACRAEIAPGLPAFEDTRDAAPYGSWTGLMAAWREELARLGEAFRAGRALVAPKRYPQTCRYCALGALCRVRERAPATSDESDG